MEKEIVSVEWLKNNLEKQDLILLDASPSQTVSGKTSDFDDQCIPTARKFNIKEKFTDKESAFPNTVPSPEQFEEECKKLGINSNSHIIVYDNLGIYTSPRVWWLFKVMGQENIQVLNGGLPEWVKHGFKTVDISDNKEEGVIGDFKSNLSSELIVSFDDITKNITSKDFLIIDARSDGRFCGAADEPRKNLQSGSIPGSINIPHSLLIENGKFKSEDALRKIFEEKLIDNNKLVFSCGSGLTACIVMLASEMVYKESRYLYDGSWTEYAIKNGLLKDNVKIDHT